MRIWIEEDKDGGGVIHGHLKLHVLPDGNREPLTFGCTCFDKGIREVMLEKIEGDLRDHISCGSLIYGPPQQEDYPDYPQGTESEEAARAEFDEATEEDQDDDDCPRTEDGDFQEDQEEEVVAAVEPEESSE